MAWRIMSDNWYSVIVNGSRHGFFHSTRGLKQGDPFSPALFIFGAEGLYRLMNKLHQKQTLQLNMETLGAYDKVSGQLINKHKSHFMVPSNAFHYIVKRIKSITGFNQKNSPITYLGCPIYIGRQRVIYYSELIAKVVNKITAWHAKILSYGGRAILVKHVLQAMSIHLLSASTPPSTTIKQI
ncbi:uncharacterized protein LOC129872015 [Solanum dulcamara]|uniref:uncharacterized protein LOC129872015 n=1 Tax=Solanum dulcamara TaxID=45834 RepID=UPI00248556FB|nr:uncharacterized protein LOC129872015 [Solanum dulcamara]